MVEQTPIRQPEVAKSIHQLVVEANQTRETLKGDPLAQATVNLDFLRQVTQTPDFKRYRPRPEEDIRIARHFYFGGSYKTVPVVVTSKSILVKPNGEIRENVSFVGRGKIVTPQSLTFDWRIGDKSLVKKFAKMTPGQIRDRVFNI